jgi:hypothetical protein
MSSIYFDRSRTAQDDACPRSRYWGVEFDGIGLELQGSSTRKHYLEFGSAVHRGMELLAKGSTPEEAYAEALVMLRPALGAPRDPGSDYDLYLKELTYLLAGFIIGYGRTVFADDLLEYEMLGVEDEILVPYDSKSGISANVSTKPDLVMRRRRDSTLWYKEFKTTSMIHEGWMRSWSRSAQLLLGGLGVQHKYGEPLKGSIIQALYKGGKYKGRSTSPFCRAYSAPDGRIKLQYAKGYNSTPVWELPQTPEEWINTLFDSPEGIELVKAQFPQTLPILWNQPLMEKWLEERCWRENTIHETVKGIARGDAPLENILGQDFPMHTGSCESSFGDPCPFVGLCYNDAAAENPLSHGYQYRIPHLSLDPANKLLKGEDND